MTTKAIPTIDVPIAPPQGESGHNRVLDELWINTIRTLAMDAVQQANSGHPGSRWPWRRSRTPCGGASAIRPETPSGRIAIASFFRGHASMLLYSTLHLAGVKAVIPNTNASMNPGHARRHQTFPTARQQMPGHPEYRLTSGVETTTGPLGQGCGN